MAAALDMVDEARTDWDSYPIGLKVLAVDDDPLCLKVVEQMLKRCNYSVKTADNGEDALAKLREKDAQIDLVLSDVYMPDMDGFKLLETIALELDVPVIMMSSNGETPVVLRGVTHGAVDFLIKPVRIEELRNVWQHVVRRKSHQGHNSREYSGDDEVVDGNRADKKRKESPGQLQLETDDNTSVKKPRVVWSVEMHQQFVNAVNSLGIDKAVPKRILDQMNVEGLTRENVASHLQKYRLYLKRVSGVHVQSGSRGKSLREYSIDSSPYSSMLPPGHSSGPATMQHPVEGITDPDGMKQQLQMHQLHDRQGITEHLKEEVALPGLLHPLPPFNTESSYETGLPAPLYGSLKHSHTQGSVLASTSLPLEELQRSSLGPLRGSGSFDSRHLSFDPQAFGSSEAHTITSSELTYPETSPLQDPSLHGLHLGAQGYLPQPSLDPFTNTDELQNRQSEQDMEKFINIFLQPSD